MRVVTDFNNGLIKNHSELKREELYNKSSNGSYFKYLYDQLEKGAVLEQPISTIIIYKDNSAVGALLFFHNIKPEVNEFFDYIYTNVGTIGVIVKDEHRKKGFAKRLLKEFEKNFLDIAPFVNDYIVINALEDAYPVALKSFKWIIPCQKQNCTQQEQENLTFAINNGKRTLKRYRYEKRRERAKLF